MEPVHKVCPMCKEDKQFSLFYINRSRKDGISTYCKPCTLSNNKKYPRRYKENREHKRETARKWRAANPEKVKAQKAREPKEKTNEYRRRWRLSNTDKVRAYQKLKVRELRDSYICCRLLSSKINEVPKELIEAKRIQIKIQRLLKNGDQ